MMVSGLFCLMLLGGFMAKMLWLTMMIALSLALLPTTVSGQGLKAESENDQTRLSKDEITRLMIQIGRVPVVEQDHKIEGIWRDQSGSKTPRSDFLFCVGLAYLGNHKAQACLGRAYEKGIGIVQDPTEAYVWYSIALDNPIDNKELKEKIQADRQRIKQGLVSMYPAPSDEDLADLVEAQKHRMTEYLAEIRNTRL
jgi:hypothetical protein